MMVGEELPGIDTTGVTIAMVTLLIACVAGIALWVYLNKKDKK